MDGLLVSVFLRGFEELDALGRWQSARTSANISSPAEGSSDNAMTRTPKPRADPELEALLEAAGAAYERGDLTATLERADAAIARDPRSVEALHYRAAALVECGLLNEGAEAYERALGLDPEDVDLLLGATELYVDRAQAEDRDVEWLGRGLDLATRGQRLARRADDVELTGDFALLAGIALGQLGRADEALLRLDEALLALPDSPEVMRERGSALFELLRLEEAGRQLHAAERLAPKDGWIQHALGLVAERSGDPKEAERRFARARKLDPEGFPPPVTLTQEEFDRVLEDALEALPEQIRRYLANVAVTVEDLPADDDLRATAPPLSPQSLGMFRGSSLGQKGSSDPWSHFPSSIVLYQRNLERSARTREELVGEIGVTLVHEVGHFLGLDEEQLWERGLD
jgi:predicted Zn-dependent protease with MMP-like domain/Flp pilus assembly protein TadD